MTGLLNLGNTCYINCILQILAFTPGFIEALRQLEESQFIICFIHTLIILKSNQKILDPGIFIKLLKQRLPKYNNNNQFDAHEFLIDLINSLDIKKDSILFSSYCLQRFHKNKSSVYDLFFGKFRKKIICISCANTNIKYEPFIDLNIFPKYKSLTENIEDYFKNSLVEYTCEVCKFKGDHKIKNKIYKYPNIIIIQLNKFGETKKISAPPASINIGTKLYSIYGITNHSGSFTNGHYKSVVYKNNNWYMMDDTSENICVDINAKDCYLYFYSKM